MAIDTAQVTNYLNEIGFSQELKEKVLGELTTNESAATQFVGQRLRHDDYTKKRQAESQQVQQYAQELANAQSKIDKIMKDFEKEQISRATAEARLQTVKTTYNLDDNDIPAVTTPAAAPAAASFSREEIEKLINDREKQLMDKINGELLAIPAVNAIQYDVIQEHQRLTGKPLSRADQLAILKDAQTNNITFQDAWERKFNIQDVRINHTVDERVATKLKEAEAARMAKASEDAIKGVRSSADTMSTAHSPVLGRTYALRNQDPVSGIAEPPAPAPPVSSAPPASGVTGQSPAPPQPRMSGAERAAAKFIERRNQGIPLGKPAAA